MPLKGEYAPSDSEWARHQAERFEATNGAEANTIRGVPIVVVTSLGRRSGKLRKTPLIRVEHDGEYLAVASKGGHHEHPTWYWNVLESPFVELQDGATRRDYEVRELSGE
jgi:F420H(2)-dependent quinone reductase